MRASPARSNSSLSIASSTYTYARKRSYWSTRSRSNSSRTLPSATKSFVNAVASGPHGSTGVLGLTVSACRHRSAGHGPCWPTRACRRRQHARPHASRRQTSRVPTRRRRAVARRAGPAVPAPTRDGEKPPPAAERIAVKTWRRHDDFAQRKTDATTLYRTPRRRAVHRLQTRSSWNRRRQDICSYTKARCPGPIAPEQRACCEVAIVVPQSLRVGVYKAPPGVLTAKVPLSATGRSGRPAGPDTLRLRALAPG